MISPIMIHEAAVKAARLKPGGPLDAMKITLSGANGKKLILMLPLHSALTFGLAIAQCGEHIAVKNDNEEGGLPS